MKPTKRDKQVAQNIWEDLYIDIVPAHTCCDDNGYDEEVISVNCLQRVLSYYGVNFDFLDDNKPIKLSNKPIKLKLTKKGKELLKRIREDKKDDKNS